jgi:Flp pilus assembly protein TadG
VEVAVIIGARLVRRGRARRGAALIELLFAMTVLLALSFGIAEYGMAFFVKHNLQAAAREGARAAIVPGATAQQVTDAVTVMLKAARLDGSGFKVVVTEAGTGKAVDVSKAAAGTMIQVEVNCTWDGVGVRVLPSSMGGIDPKKVLYSATVMRKEG